MNNAVLIQHVNENSPHMHLLEKTFSRHARYCLVNKMDYNLSMAGGGVPGDWEKVALIRRALQEYGYVIWLDADAMIREVRCDLRQACIRPVNAVQFNNPYPHLNVGVLYLRAGAQATAFVEEWFSRKPGPEHWREQAVFNELSSDDRFSPDVGILHDAFNCVDFINPTPEPIVMAWHGYSALSTLQVIGEKMDQAIKTPLSGANVLGV